MATETLHSHSIIKLNDETYNYLQNSLQNIELQQELGKVGCDDKFQWLLKNLSIPPLFTTLRINTLYSDLQTVKLQVENELKTQYRDKDQESPRVSVHPKMTDLLVIENSGPHPLIQHDKEVIVDLSCGMAVLRGADVFVQGIMAAPASLSLDDAVSVYADLDGKCRKGLMKSFTDRKLHVGNGRSKVTRQQLFVSKEQTCGVGIAMTTPLYSAPCLSDLLLDVTFAQNIPSVVCVHVLDPQPGETILDMCAAPGGKTNHIATLMKNKGRVVAFDKSPAKVDKVLKNAKRWKLSIVEAYVQDGRRSMDCNSACDGGPPYPAASFDRVLLDAPCSALGQRPCIVNRMTIKEVKSYPPLQKQLFATAVELLKCGGILVYSTCSIPVEENEAMVAWALQHYPCLQLTIQKPHISGPSWPASQLSLDQREKLQRFDPSDICNPDGNITADTDTIGFFIAKFVKS